MRDLTAFLAVSFVASGCYESHVLNQDASIQPDAPPVPCDNNYFVDFVAAHPVHLIALERWHGGDDYFVDDAGCAARENSTARLIGAGCLMSVPPEETLGFRVALEPVMGDGPSGRFFPCSFDPAEEAAIGTLTVTCGSEEIRILRVPDSTGCAYRTP